MSPIDTTPLKPRFSVRGALVLLPPQSIWEQIDAIREQHDAQIVRWMPHLRLLHPFKKPEEFEDILPAVREVARSLEPLSLTLTDVRYFTHPSGKGSLWLAPEPADAVIAVYQAFQKEFPEFSQEHRFEKGFVPHIIVGQTRTHKQARRISMELSKDWKPLPISIGSAALVGRDYSGPMRVVHEIPFGTVGN